MVPIIGQRQCWFARHRGRIGEKRDVGLVEWPPGVIFESQQDGVFVSNAKSLRAGGGPVTYEDAKSAVAVAIVVLVAENGDGRRSVVEVVAVAPSLRDDEAAAVLNDDEDRAKCITKEEGAKESTSALSPNNVNQSVQSAPTTTENALSHSFGPYVQDQHVFGAGPPSPPATYARCGRRSLELPLCTAKPCATVAHPSSTPPSRCTDKRAS